MRREWIRPFGVLLLGGGLSLQGGCDYQDRSVLPSELQVVGALAKDPASPGPGMDFPFEHPDQVDRFYCFGLFPWDAEGLETHGGTDIVPLFDPAATDVLEVPLVAVADGRVARIIESTPGSGLPAITIVLELNPYWFATHTIEPQTPDPGRLDRGHGRARGPSPPRFRDLL